MADLEEGLEEEGDEPDNCRSTTWPSGPGPQVLARYNNDLPMLVRRQWGQGQVLFLTTSLSPEWTTLHDLPQSAWLMDHIARCVLSETLTAWNVSSEKGLVLPVAMGERGARFTLVDPDGQAAEPERRRPGRRPLRHRPE